MGSCSSAPKVDNVTKNINKHMDTEYQDLRRIKNILVIGAKHCGKSTICRQIDYIGNKDTNAPFVDFENEIRNIRQQCIQAVLYMSHIINDKDTSDSLSLIDLESARQDDLIYIGNIISSVCKRYNNIDELLSSIQTRTNDINPNIQYYLNKIDDIFMNPNYIPSQQDIINSHISHVAPSVHKYYVAEQMFNFVDLDEKWDWNKYKKLYYFEGYIAVVFVASSSDYCVSTQMQESIDWFDYIVNCKWFKKSEIILFLNKDDLFRKRIKDGYSLSICFGDKWNGPEYLQGKIGLVVSHFIRKENYLHVIPIDIINLLVSFSAIRCTIDDVEVTQEEYFEHCYTQSLSFIKEQYESRFKRNSMNQFGMNMVSKYIYTHVVCAIDRDLMEKILWDIKNITTRGS